MRSPEEIRGMDGPALTRLAYDMGLAPHGTTLTTDIYGRGARYITNAWVQTGYDFWEPHTNLVQAEVVFRKLRAQGCTTRLFWYEEQQGSVSVMRKDTLLYSVGFTASTEAHALLLISVLAVASEQPAVDNGD